MSIDDAIASGAQALHDDTCPDDECGGLHGEDRDALTAARAMWPILSAGLRELHPREEFADAPGEFFCRPCQSTAGIWPCETMQTIQKIDKELGL